jgi:hypothetical protein
MGSLIMFYPFFCVKRNITITSINDVFFVDYQRLNMISGILDEFIAMLWGFFIGCILLTIGL